MKTRSLQNLLNIVNAATNPAAFRTDHESTRNRQLAGVALKAIEKAGYIEGRHYRETDHSGRLVGIGIYR